MRSKSLVKGIGSIYLYVHAIRFFIVIWLFKGSLLQARPVSLVGPVAPLVLKRIWRLNMINGVFTK